MRGGYGYYNAPSVAEQQMLAEKRLKKLRKKDPQVQPIVIEGSKISKTWWGISWCKNLERYADYQNRIGRGRAYVKNGLVLDLRIAEGGITAIISGKRLYEVYIRIDKLPDEKWKPISELCAKRIDSIAVLVEGKFPQEFQDLFMRQGDGLFPSPKEIHLDCSCPDWASMCKHVAAALYAVGAKLDTDPHLFFTLRGIDPAGFIKKSVDEKMKSLLMNAEGTSERVIDDKDIPRIFGLKVTSIHS